MAKIVDASFDCTASIPCLRAEGVERVIRYYSRTTKIPGKRLTRTEADALAAAGFGLGAVYQDRQNQAGDFSEARGALAGAHAAEYARDAIGQPAGSAIYVAVDFDASAAEIRDAVIPFFRGFAGALAEQGGGAAEYAVGVYGSGLTCKRVIGEGLASFAWLSGSMGFRGTRDAVRAGEWHLKQTVDVPLCNRIVDTNEANAAKASFGFFRLNPELRGGDSPAARAAAQRRVIARDGLRLRAGPGTSFEVRRVMPFGAVLFVLETANDWSQVDLDGDGKADGHCAASFLRELE